MNFLVNPYIFTKKDSILISFQNRVYFYLPQQLVEEKMRTTNGTITFYKHLHKLLLVVLLTVCFPLPIFWFSFLEMQ